jgi:pyruvate-formate lyase-activating enzyme
VDPVEKKPFLHVLPGSRSFSIATAGCNLGCKFCQNWEISQARPETDNRPTPEKVGRGPENRLPLHRLYLCGAHYLL